MTYQQPPQQPPEPPTPPQQPYYQPQQPYPPQQQYYAPPPQEPKKGSKVWLWVILGILGLCVICGVIGAVVFAASGNIISKNIDQITGQLTQAAPTVNAVQTMAAGFTPEPTSAEATVEPTQEQGNAPSPRASGIITGVTMARGVTGEEMKPENPTEVFGQKDTFHAVTKIENAPANTQFKATWYAENVGDAASPNTLIDSTEITSDGTRYLDFNLTPNNNWPTGTYRVEIFVNGNLDQVVNFSVQ